LNARTFSVSANNRAVLKAWDPAKAAGGVMKAAKVSFKVKVVDGHLKLQFAPVGGPALIAAIEVTP
jgi:beta-galactosidase